MSWAEYTSVIRSIGQIQIILWIIKLIGLINSPCSLFRTNPEPESVWPGAAMTLECRAESELALKIWNRLHETLLQNSRNFGVSNKILSSFFYFMHKKSPSQRIRTDLSLIDNGSINPEMLPSCHTFNIPVTSSLSTFSRLNFNISHLHSLFFLLQNTLSHPTHFNLCSDSFTPHPLQSLFRFFHTPPTSISVQILSHPTHFNLCSDSFTAHPLQSLFSFFLLRNHISTSRKSETFQSMQAIKKLNLEFKKTNLRQLASGGGER